MRFGYNLYYVRDVEATVAFYEAAFGLERKFVHENDYGELKTGNTTLGFVSLELARSNGIDFVESSPLQSPPVEIGFVTQDVTAAYQFAIDHGAAPVVAPKEKPWGQVVSYVRDLNGFLVEICSPMVEE